MWMFEQACGRDGEPAGDFPWEPASDDTRGILALASAYGLLPSWWTIGSLLGLHALGGGMWGCIHQALPAPRVAQRMPGAAVTVCAECRRRIDLCRQRSDYELVTTLTRLVHRVAFHSRFPSALAAAHVHTALDYLDHVTHLTLPRAQLALDINGVLAQARSIPREGIYPADLAVVARISQHHHLTWARAALLGGSPEQCTAAAKWTLDWYPADPTCQVPPATIGSPAEDVVLAVTANTEPSDITSLGKALGDRRVLAVSLTASRAIRLALRMASEDNADAWIIAAPHLRAHELAHAAQTLARAVDGSRRLSLPAHYLQVAADLLDEPEAFDVALRLAPSWQLGADELIGASRSLLNA